METASETNENQKIDVKTVLLSKNPALAKTIPGFVINYLKRIVHQDELNEFLGKWGHLKDSEIVAAWLKYIGIKFKVYGSENIPKSGRYIFVSNHPLGGLDGVVFIHELSKHFNDIKFPVNDILTSIKNLSGIFLPINKHGSQAKESAIDDRGSIFVRLSDSLFSCRIVFKEKKRSHQGPAVAEKFYN